MWLGLGIRVGPGELPSVRSRLENSYERLQPRLHDPL
jgi:hypothetical protein